MLVGSRRGVKKFHDIWGCDFIQQWGCDFLQQRMHLMPHRLCSDRRLKMYFFYLETIIHLRNWKLEEHFPSDLCKYHRDLPWTDIRTHIIWHACMWFVLSCLNFSLAKSSLERCTLPCISIDICIDCLDVKSYLNNKGFFPIESIPGHGTNMLHCLGNFTCTLDTAYTCWWSVIAHLASGI